MSGKGKASGVASVDGVNITEAAISIHGVSLTVRNAENVETASRKLKKAFKDKDENWENTVYVVGDKYVFITASGGTYSVPQQKSRKKGKTKTTTQP